MRCSLLAQRVRVFWVEGVRLVQWQIVESRMFGEHLLSVICSRQESLDRTKR